MNITQHSTSVGYSQANGQAENFNRTVLHGLKTQFYRGGATQVDHLPCVLWSYRTTSKIAVQETPFSLIYEAEVVVSTEVVIPSSMVNIYVAEKNEQAQQTDLDLLEKRKEVAPLKMVQHKNVIAWHYNARVKSCILNREILSFERTGQLELNL